MITQEVAQGVAILSGVGGFLTCAAMVLVGRLFASPQRRGCRKRATERTQGRAERISVPPVTTIRAQPDRPDRARRQGSRRFTGSVAATHQTASAVRVQPRGRPLWQHRRWEPRGNTLHGFYRTALGTFEGEIQQYRSSRPLFFIMAPPPELRRHEHWICFHATGPNRFWVHLTPKPRDPDTGIREIERILIEALSRRSNG